ncbi:MAG TPA: tetratricopeptide repeat protein [Burkholderiaceae bacterium]
MIAAPGSETARRPWAALLLCLALAACADAPAPPVAGEALFSDASFAPPSEPIAAADVFKLSPEMHAWLESRAAGDIKSHGEARGLLEALFMDRRLRIDYDAEFTRNAAQAFEARAGNCLSLAIVTGAMAKEMGLDVRYQAISTSDHWERDGDLLELVGHVNVSVALPVPKLRSWGLNTDRWTVDFLSPAEMRTLTARPITESRVAAMFMNNRAAEALAHQRVDDAYWWARAGIGTDPSFASLYNTLGVTYLRKGLLARSEAALRFAVSVAPDSTQSWNNLAIVLRREGLVEQAAAIDDAHPRPRAALLMAAMDDGMKANRAGDYARALELFNRALRVAGDNHQVHYQLAVTYLNLGDRRRALEHLREAEDDSLTARQRSVYASKIELLKSRQSSFRLDPDVLQVN